METSSAYGMTFAYDPEYGFIPNESYNSRVIKILQEELKPDDTFVDIGANIGLMSCVAAKLCKKVVAIEPDVDSYMLLSRNIIQNKSWNVSTVWKALSDKKEIVQFQPLGPHSTCFKRQDGVGLVGMLADKLDDLNLTARVVKLCAMGYDKKVMDGGREFFKNVEVLTLEHHPGLMRLAGDDPEAFVANLEKTYKLEVLPGGSLDNVNLILRK